MNKTTEMHRNPRFRRRPSWILAAVVAVLVAITFSRSRQSPRSRTNIKYPSIADSATGVCTRVTDGDTITVAGFDKIRLIGIDCPESNQAGGASASAMTRELVLDREVRVEVCPVKPTDQYGRKRVVVFVRDSSGDERNVAIELLRRGYANVYSLPPCHLDTGEWLKYAREARDAGRGLWSSIGEVPTGHRGATTLSSVGEASSPIVLVSAQGKRFHERGCSRLPKHPIEMSRDDAMRNGYTACKVCGG